jgi:hypothetical protein
MYGIPSHCMLELPRNFVIFVIADDSNSTNTASKQKKQTQTNKSICSH